MMNKVSWTALLGGVLLIGGLGCGKIEPTELGGPVAIVEEAPAEPATASPATFKLNDGKKWKVDAPTGASIGRMDGLLADAKPVDTAGYQELGAAFRAELKTLVMGCEMEGPAHDELHVLLGALFPRVAVLERGDVALSTPALAEIRALFGAYHGAFD